MNENLTTQFGDVNFAMIKMMESAPKLGLLREAVRNALDANATRVWIYSKNISKRKMHKAVILDNGVGMSEQTLRNMAKINSLFDREVGKDENNFNSGIRIMGVPANESGLVFVSKHNGVIRNVLLSISNGEFKATYNARGYNTDIGDDDRNIKGNWTAVILLGCSSEQNTFTHPYGRGIKSPFVTQVKNRFNNLLNKKGDDVLIFVNGEKTTSIENVFNDSQQWRVKGRGFTVQYTLNTERPISGLMAEGEVYDICIPTATALAGTNSNLVGALGAYAIKKELSVLVELDEALYCHHQHRNQLLNPTTKTELKVGDYLKHIVRLVPKELQDYIHAKSDEQQTEQLQGLSENLQRQLMSDMLLDLKKLKKPKGEPKPKGDTTPKSESKKTTPKSEPKKPTEAEEVKGLPIMTAGFAPVEDDFIFEPHQFAYVLGDMIYFDKNHSVFKYALESTQELSLPSLLRKQKFIELVTKEYPLALAFDLSKEASGAVLLTTAVTLISQGLFKKSLTAQVKG